MALGEHRIEITDSFAIAANKINAILEEIIGAVGDYPSLKDYIEGLVGGVKGTVEATPEGVTVYHDFNTEEYQVITTANDNVTTWYDKSPNSIVLYASDVAEVDYAILSTTDALRLIKDNESAVQEIVDARNGYPALIDYLKFLENKVPEGVRIKRHVIDATEGQSVCYLPEGSTYVQGTNTMNVFVGGVKQRSNLDFRELSPTQVRFNTPLKKGWSVELIWLNTNPTLLDSHNKQHEFGGSDEIRVHGLQILDKSIPDTALQSAYHKKVSMKTSPKEGAWKLGDIVYDEKPTSGGFLGWVCIKAGEFGTWEEPVFKSFGRIE